MKTSLKSVQSSIINHKLSISVCPIIDQESMRSFLTNELLYLCYSICAARRSFALAIDMHVFISKSDQERLFSKPVVFSVGFVVRQLVNVELCNYSV